MASATQPVNIRFSDEDETAAFLSEDKRYFCVQKDVNKIALTYIRGRNPHVSLGGEEEAPISAGGPPPYP